MGPLQPPTDGYDPNNLPKPGKRKRDEDQSESSKRARIDDSVIRVAERFKTALDSPPGSTTDWNQVFKDIEEYPGKKKDLRDRVLSATLSTSKRNDTILHQMKTGNQEANNQEFENLIQRVDNIRLATSNLAPIYEEKGIQAYEASLQQQLNEALTQAIDQTRQLPEGVVPSPENLEVITKLIEKGASIPIHGMDEVAEVANLLLLHNRYPENFYSFLFNALQDPVVKLKIVVEATSNRALPRRRGAKPFSDEEAGLKIAELMTTNPTVLPELNNARNTALILPLLVQSNSLKSIEFILRNELSIVGRDLLLEIIVDLPEIDTEFRDLLKDLAEEGVRFSLSDYSPIIRRGDQFLQKSIDLNLFEINTINENGNNLLQLLIMGAIDPRTDQGIVESLDNMASLALDLGCDPENKNNENSTVIDLAEPNKELFPVFLEAYYRRSSIKGWQTGKSHEESS